MNDSKRNGILIIFLVLTLVCEAATGCIKDVPAPTTVTPTSSASSTEAPTTSFSTTSRSTTPAALTSAETKAASTTPETVPAQTKPPSETDYELRLTVIVTNDRYDPALVSEWGFSCLIETAGKMILFDTGADGDTLLGNMKKLNLDPLTIDTVVLSHEHRDHTGGLSDFLKTNPNVMVCLPASFSKNLKEQIQSSGAAVKEMAEAEALFAGIYSTGEMGGEIKEQALVMETNQGLVVLTGCAHPGIVSIVGRAQEMLPDKPLFLVMGGFHLAWDTTSQIKRVVAELRQMGVVKVAPCHCSGDEARSLFKKEYAGDFLPIGAGWTVNIP